RSLNYPDTVKNIASQINSTLKEVEPVLKRLSDSGFLAIDNKTIEILNTEELDKLAGYFK
ncbi:MAG: hypothetical protein KAJ15_03625, partial [Spirochaetes bacterium]|nr:hypothetical protein [Spirochaetota bacterium]